MKGRIMDQSENSSTEEMAAQLTKGHDRVDIKSFAGGLEQEIASLPQIRFSKKWFSTQQILTVVVPVGFALALIAVATAQQLRTMPDVQAFIQQYPGTGSFSQPVTDGFPWWLRAQHYLNMFIMIFMFRSGLQILVEHPRFYSNGHCTPGTEWFRLRGPVPTDRVWTAKDDTLALPHWLGLPGVRHAVGLARGWHFPLATFWLLNGVVFVVLLFATDQWQRFVPQSWDIFPHAASTAIQYASLDFPPPSGWHQYNALQMISYFTTVFVAAPLAVFTGLLQSPAIAARFKTATGPFNRQISRALHFGVLCYFGLFITIHLTMVFSAGLIENLNHIFRGVNDDSYGGLLIFVIAMALIAVAWIAATPFTLKHPRLVQRFARAITGWAENLLEDFTPVANFEEKDISPHFWPNGHGPDSEEYRQHQAEGFANYIVKIGGLVENPVELTMDEIKALPKTEQITESFCIQGWSGIAKWGGVRMSEIIKIVRPKPGVRFVVFYAVASGPGEYDDEKPGLFYDCHKFKHMKHDQTMLAYEMNGDPIPELHGAPLRLRNELELAFKQIKWIQAIEFVDSFKDLGSGEGGFNPDNEFFDYRAPM